jgi:hypothetical protein
MELRMFRLPVAFVMNVACASCGTVGVGPEGDAIDLPLPAASNETAAHVASGLVETPPTATVAAVPSASSVASDVETETPATASSGPVDPAIVALPKEPWYGNDPDHTDECVAPLAKTPARHFPAPFDACDTRVESWASPPGSPGLHFHYRNFSVALTREKRKQTPGVCCYMVWEFPR